MADKKFTEKVGKDGLIDFDPVNGIMRYGAYEVFAKDLGIEPSRQEVNFDDYLTAATKRKGVAGLALVPPTAAEKAKLRAQFESDLTSGAFGPVKPSASSTGLFGASSEDSAGGFGFADPVGGIGNIKVGIKPPKTTFRSVQKLGPDSFAVDVYNIPVADYDLVNKIGAKAAGLKFSGADDAVLQQNQSDAKARRQGRASTVLSSDKPSTVNA